MSGNSSCAHLKGHDSSQKRPRRWVQVPADQPAPEMPGGFAVLPQRWIVERTFAWLVRNRRLTKDWEGSNGWRFTAEVRHEAIDSH